MTVVRKRKQSSSITELMRALQQFILLLEKQEENEAAQDLGRALLLLQQSNPAKIKEALDLIEEAFEGEHELEAYTISRKKADDAWTEAEALYLASTGVRSLSNRIKKSL